MFLQKAPCYTSCNAWLINKEQNTCCINLSTKAKCNTLLARILCCTQHKMYNQILWLVFNTINSDVGIPLIRICLKNSSSKQSLFDVTISFSEWQKDNLEYLTFFCFTLNFSNEGYDTLSALFFQMSNVIEKHCSIVMYIIMCGTSDIS